MAATMNLFRRDPDLRPDFGYRMRALTAKATSKTFVTPFGRRQRARAFAATRTRWWGLRGLKNILKGKGGISRMKKQKADPLAPRWLLYREGMTQRQWQSKKRQQVKACQAALERYRVGCVFCPIQMGDLRRIIAILAKWRRAHAIAEWKKYSHVSP